MSHRRLSFLAAIVAAPLWATMPAAIAQEAPGSELNDDQQKMLDLINKGMDVERADKPVEAERIHRRWIEEAAQRYGADGLLTSLGYRLLAGSLESQNRFKEAEPLWKRL